MISYYRRFISGFSDITHPLHRLLQKDVKFEGNQSCQNSFESWKEQLISSPILGFPDTDKDYVLYTDASDVGIGAVLTQKDENGTERVISFASKAFSDSEKNWTTQKRKHLRSSGLYNISTHTSMVNISQYSRITELFSG